jgi:hypothetical protein
MTATFILQSRRTGPHAIIRRPMTMKEVEKTTTAEGSNTRRRQSRSTMRPHEERNCCGQHGLPPQDRLARALRPSTAAHRCASLAASPPRGESRQEAPPSPPPFGGRASAATDASPWELLQGGRSPPEPPPRQQPGRRKERARGRGRRVIGGRGGTSSGGGAGSRPVRCDRLASYLFRLWEQIEEEFMTKYLSYKLIFTFFNLAIWN